MGPFKYARVREDDFIFNRAEVWERYRGIGTMEKFWENWNVV